jgi:hypothetical protein
MDRAASYPVPFAQMPSTGVATEVAPVRPRKGHQCAAACALALVGFFAMDGLLFRTGGYASILEPDSSTGLFELVLRRELAAQKRYGDNMIATFGDSRFAYSPKLANGLTPQTGYVFRSAGVAGTNERIWYYMLRDLDPTARRYRAIAFGVSDYDDEDADYNPFDDVRALHYVIARLRLGDVLSFAGSFESRAARLEALRGALLKGIVYQNDVLAFLTHPLKRIAYVQQCSRGYEEWTYDFQETQRSMAGLEIDWNTWQAKFPPGADQDQRDTVNYGLMHRSRPQTGHTGRFRRLWLGRILERYRGSRTKIIFLRLPRGPIPRPDGVYKPVSSVIREFALRPGVTLIDEHAFDSLERPELFKDGLHLNRAGIARFSPLLAEKIGQMLGRPEASSRAF